MASDIDNVILENGNSIRDPIDYISTKVNHSLFLYAVDSSEILQLISNLELRKACGYDLISNRIIKATSYVAASHLTRLFNNCINQGIFPDIYKLAQVIPLYKGGDKENLNSYRPISLLPALGKLLEKIVSSRTVSFFEENDLFSPYQFGFRAKFSTEYTVLDIYEKLLQNLDGGFNTCAIFLDLAKAFDSVSHNILLRKLEKYGIRGNVLKFFASYLHSRKQFVKLNNVSSDIAHLEFGVPQGSILGPLLFLIYINDLPSASSFYIRLFADDTFLCAQNENISLLESETNAELVKVYEWLLSNKLTLNISKSKYMIVTNKKLTGSITVQINGQQLEECQTYKYLGVYIDKNISWKTHTEHVCTKLSRACGALAKTRHYVSEDVLKSIYYALLNSYIRYGLTTWGNASYDTLQPLRVLTNRAVRIMSFAPFGRLDTKPIYTHFNILDVDNTFLLEAGKLNY